MQVRSVDVLIAALCGFVAVGVFYAAATVANAIIQCAIARGVL